MAVYKEEKTGTWRVIYRYTDWTGERKQTTIKNLQRDLKFARRDAQIWKRRYEELKEQAKDFLAAVRKAPEQIMAFISKVLHTEQAEPPRVQRQRESAVER